MSAQIIQKSIRHHKILLPRK